MPSILVYDTILISVDPLAGIYLYNKDLNTTYWKEIYDRTRHENVIPETETDRGMSK